MSGDFQQTIVVGRLGKDPETRYTPQGSPVTSFSLAANYEYTPSGGGEKVRETEWYNVVAWNKLAEVCTQYLRKGSRVLVTGRQRTHSWDDQATGQKRYKTELIADTMKMMDSKAESEARNGAAEAAPDDDFADEPPAVVVKTPVTQPRQQAASPVKAAPKPQTPVTNGNGRARRPATLAQELDDELPF